MPSLATMISSSRRCDTLRYSRTGNWMFWRTVSEENSAPCWNRMPQRRFDRTAQRGIGGVEIDTEHFDAAGDLGHEADDGARQDRLAGAGGTDKAQNLAAP